MNVSGGFVNYIRGGSSSLINGDISLNISGGTVNYAYAGGKSGAVTNGNSRIKITGGEIKSVYGTGMFTEHNGNVEIILAGGKVTNVTGAYGKNVADVSITLDGNKTEFAENARVTGYSVYTPNGDMVLNVGTSDTAFDGTLKAAIDKFDRVDVADNSDMVFAGKISNVENLSIGAGSNVAFENAADIAGLNVNYTAKVIFGESAEVSFDWLTVDNFDKTCTQESSYEFDLAQIFGESATIVESALAGGAKLSVVDANGLEWAAEYSEGRIDITGAVPEPAVYTAVLGALALAFAAHRGRK